HRFTQPREHGSRDQRPNVGVAHTLDGPVAYGVRLVHPTRRCQSIAPQCPTRRAVRLDQFGWAAVADDGAMARGARVRGAGLLTVGSFVYCGLMAPAAS